MDDLAEINGIKPNVVLVEGEEHKVKSASSKSGTTYKLKRTFDHYYCTCPAWRNQKGVETNARTCKHLKSLLGEAYEAARLAMRTGSGSTVTATAAAAKAKPASKAKAAAAAKKPASKAKATSATAKKPAPRGRKVKEEVFGEEDDGDDDDCEGEVDEDAMDVDSKPEVNADANDELAIINGIAPRLVLVEGEEHEVKSATSKSGTVYKVKRTFDHYYCTCPAWRNQKGVETNSRTCKHLKQVLGEAYETARLAMRAAGGSSTTANPKPPSKAAAGKKAPASKAKAGSKRKVEDEGNEEDEEEDVRPVKKARIATAAAKNAKAGPAAVHEENEAVIKPVEGDELAEIDGHKPLVYMPDGSEREVSSATSSSNYKVKRTWDHYYCSCPAWRNQGGSPVNARTCKHLQALLGHNYEAARLFLKNPEGPAPKAPRATKSKAKGKGKGDAGGEDGGEAGGIPGMLLAVKWDIDDGPDPTGWWISEKLDGVRTYYDGKGGFFSRNGNPFTPPAWFVATLPKGITLDGELFSGRGEFQSAVSIVKTVNSPHWKGISFQVFDVPSEGSKPFEDRMKIIGGLFGAGGSHVCAHVKVVEHEAAKGRSHVLEKLKEFEELGGEGVMLRKPKSLYEGTRSSSLMKVKTFFDAEAIVTGHAAGKGKHAGSTGALMCKMASGKTFNCGSGLSDKQRKNPPAIGSIIVYRFQELTKDGVPRFPTFVGEAADKLVPKDAEIPETRKGGANGGD